MLVLVLITDSFVLALVALDVRVSFNCNCMETKIVCRNANKKGNITESFTLNLLK